MVPYFDVDTLSLYLCIDLLDKLKNIWKNVDNNFYQSVVLSILVTKIGIFVTFTQIPSESENFSIDVK